MLAPSGSRFRRSALAARGIRKQPWQGGVQLAYGAHHDAITGSESDQVYLDLLTGWRDAWELAGPHASGALRLCRRRWRPKQVR